MDSEKEKNIRETEERIRKIDDFLLAVNSTIEGVLDEFETAVKTFLEKE